MEHSLAPQWEPPFIGALLFLTIEDNLGEQFSKIQSTLIFKIKLSIEEISEQENSKPWDMGRFSYFSLSGWFFRERLVVLISVFLWTELCEAGQFSIDQIQLSRASTSQCGPVEKGVGWTRETYVLLHA